MLQLQDKQCTEQNVKVPSTLASHPPLQRQQGRAVPQLPFIRTVRMHTASLEAVAQCTELAFKLLDSTLAGAAQWVEFQPSD